MECNPSNFYMSTRATFTPHPVPNRTPDYMSDSGSQYWYTPTGVIRHSDHWGERGSHCSWYLAGSYCGFCAFENFEHIPRPIRLMAKNTEAYPEFNFVRDSIYAPGYCTAQTKFDYCKDGYVYVHGRWCLFNHKGRRAIRLDF